MAGARRERDSSDDESEFMEEVATTVVNCLESVPSKQEVARSIDTLEGKDTASLLLVTTHNNCCMRTIHQ